MLDTPETELDIKFEYQTYITNCESGKFRPVISKVVENRTNAV